MIDNGLLVALIPAKGLSERIPRKNMALFAGKPLIHWSIDAALKSKFADRVIVSTEDREIEQTAKCAGAEVPFKRPMHLATGSALSIDVVDHVLSELESRGESIDYVMLLQPTSPLRNAEHIDSAIELMLEQEANAVISVTVVEHPVEWAKTLSSGVSMDNFYGPEFNLRSQDLPVRYRVNGAIYVAKCEQFKKENSFFLGKGTVAYVMDRDVSVDIDTPFDFRLAEQLLQHQDDC